VTVIRVQFVVPTASDEPCQFVIATMNECPRVGDYVNLDDGVDRYVAAVTWEPFDETVEGKALNKSYEAYVELKEGAP